MPSYLHSHHLWDPRKVSIMKRGQRPESIGFAIPRETPVPSPRLDGHLYLCLSSVVALASLASAVPSHLRTGGEVACLTIQGISFSIALVTGVSLRYDPSRGTLTTPFFHRGTPLGHVSLETVMNSLQLLLWFILTGLSFSSPRLTNDTVESIWNTNLYYSTWAGLGVATFQVADSYTAESPQVYWNQEHNFKPAALQRNWVLVLVAQIGLMAFCFEGMAGCTDGCSTYSLGLSLALIGALFAIGHIVLRIVQNTRMIRPQGFKKVGFVEIVCASFNFVLATVNAALLSGDNGDSSINVFFACWIAFLLSLNLSLRYVDAYFSPGSLMNDAEYSEWAKMNAPPPRKTDALIKRQSTGSTRSSKSSTFVARVQDAAMAEAHLESMVASNASSDPVLYLDNKTANSPLSMDEEFGNNFPALPPPIYNAQAKRDDPSVFVPQTGVDPQPSLASKSQQQSVRALMPPVSSMPARSRGLSIDPEESVSVSTPSTRDPPAPQLRKTATMAPAPPPRQRESVMRQNKSREKPRITMFPLSESDGSVSTASEYQRGPLKRASVARDVMAESVSTSSEFEGLNREHPLKQQHNRYQSVQSMTGFVRQRPSMSVPTKTAPSRKTWNPKNASMLSLFEEGISQQVEIATQPPSDQSSPNTLEPPPTLEPSLSSSKLRAQSPGIIRASPSIKSGRTNKSRQSMGTSKESKSRSRTQSSKAQSRASSRAKSSTTHGSRGPPTLSEDGSRKTDHGSGPLTLSENEDDLVYNADIHESSSDYRPVRDISMDDLSIVSDPTMDGFDQSQRFNQSFNGTFDGGEDIGSQTGTVDQMVMMALKQAYESRQQSLLQARSDERSRDTRSSLQNIPRRASDGATHPRPPPREDSFIHSSSERILTKNNDTKRTDSSGVTGSSGKSIRSFYSNNADSKGDGSSAFAC